MEGIELYNKLSEHEKELYEKIKKEGNREAGGEKAALISPLNDMIDFNPFQYIPYVKLQQQNEYPKRVYIADEVGAGKTIETGIIISELMYQKEINVAEHKCLIICPNLLCKKWRYTLKSLFGINAVIIRSLSDIMNGFNIVSFNTVSSSDMKECELNLLIIDEAHNASLDRFEKVKTIRDRVCEKGYVILLSATPVSGASKDVENQLRLLHGGDYKLKDRDSTFFDPSNDNDYDYLCKNRKAYMRYAADPEHYKEVTTSITNHFVENKALVYFLNEAEELFDGKNTLLLYQGLNSIMSSPAAADVYFREFLKKSVDELVEYLQSSHVPSEDDESADDNVIYEDNENCEDDYGSGNREYTREDAEEIRGRIEEISKHIQEIINDPSKDNKLNELKTIISDNKKEFDKKENDKKKEFFGHVLVFTDRVSTAEYLEEELKKEYSHVFKVTGKLFESDKLNRLQQYKDVKDDISILIITNVACEGQDMDFGNTIVNYDLDYNPVRLEQRKGRVDRFKVTKDTVYIHNFAVEDFDYDPDRKSEEQYGKYIEYSKVKKICDKIDQIKEMTGIFYEILQNDPEHDPDSKLDPSNEMSKEDLEKKVKEVYGSVLGLTEEIQNLPSSSEELRQQLILNIMKKIDGSQGYGGVNEQEKDGVNKQVDAYVNRILRKDGISVQPTEDGKVVITVDKKNQEFLDKVYYGGTRISHIIARG